MIYKGPEVLTLDITYNCNFRCLHCFNNSGEQDLGLNELTDDEVINLCDDIIKLSPNTVCICGGEPLLKRELVLKVIKKITKESNSNIKVNMVTNGYLVNDSIVKELVNSGINAVQISLDGHCNSTHDWLRNKEGAFEKALNAIKIFRENKVRVDVAFSPTKKNINYVKETMELCENLGVTCFRTQPLMGLGRAKINLREYMLDYFEYMKLNREVIDYSRKSDNNLMTEWGDPLEHLKSPIYTNMTYNKFVSINAYGYIVMSPYAPVYLGNIKKYSLKNYWDNGLEEIWSSQLLKDICKLYRSFDDMDISSVDNIFPSIHNEKGILIDIIDDKEVFEYSLNDFKQIKKELINI